MAGHKINTRLTSSTLLEVIISMVIISIVFTMVIGIISHIQRLSVTVKQIKVQAILQDQLILEEQTQSGSQQTDLHSPPDILPNNLDSTPKSIFISEYKIEKKWSSYTPIILSESGSIKVLSLTGYDLQLQKIAGIKKLIYEP
jgi:type II secretory pathway pseudopilin PulG